MILPTIPLVVITDIKAIENILTFYRTSLPVEGKCLGIYHAQILNSKENFFL